jgi:hypothetical protein
LQLLLKDGRIKRGQVSGVLLVDLHELLRVVDLLFEQNEGGHLADKIVTQANHVEF